MEHEADGELAASAPVRGAWIMMLLTPPGWYPDPSGARWLRFWNGCGWTGHLSPAPPHPPAVFVNAVAPPAPFVRSTHANYTALYFVLTLVSCGLFLPVWLLVVVIDHYTAPTRSCHRGFVSAHRFLTMFGTVYAVLFAVADWKVALWIAIVSVVVSLFAIAIGRPRRVKKMWREERDALSARADWEHRALMSGDQRVGTFGRFQPANLSGPIPT